MIHTAKQLKDKVRNISHSNSEVAQALIRHFYMERFLERVSKSKYRDNFILKGGMLVASIIGANLRSTMDIDSSIRALPLNENDAKRIIEEIRKMLNETTYDMVVRIMELIDGYSGYSSDKHDIINTVTGERLKETPFIELHDMLDGRLKN